MSSCHCSQCRKTYGAAFGTVAVVAADGFRYTEGEGEIASYRQSERVTHYFCRTCGSALPISERWEPLVGVPAGLLDDDPGIKPGAHIFVGSKAPWCDITDGIAQFEAWPPDEDLNAQFERLKTD